MSGVNEIRSSFLDYFARNGHEIVPSSPLVPRNDPTLMFTNSGMVQFKNVFTGLEKRRHPRAATAQKCVRAGGKHNDLDNVGYTARHHTFFEMLGNFSFGDYFKDRAIELAWNLVTREFGLPSERLMVTVYVDDDDAFELWKKIAGLPESKIVRIAGSDNFWQMGDLGPCGPCSEIFYDHGDKIPGGPPGSPDADGDRFIEIWNLVFMQFEQHAGGSRTNLPRPYSRIHVVQGTKGLFQGYPHRAYIEGRGRAHQWLEATDLLAEYEHPLWKEIAEQAAGAGHGGMDYIEDYRLIKCLREGTPTDMDVYDAAALSAVVELSCQSVAKNGRPIECPDFTRGRWRTRPPLPIVHM